MTTLAGSALPDPKYVPVATKTFAWDASPTPGVVYFLLGSRVSGDYVHPVLKVPCGTGLTRTVFIPETGQWYFVCVAYKSGMFSDPSNEVHFNVRPVKVKLNLPRTDDQ